MTDVELIGEKLELNLHVIISLSHVLQLVPPLAHNTKFDIRDNFELDERKIFGRKIGKLLG